MLQGTNEKNAVCNFNESKFTGGNMLQALLFCLQRISFVVKGLFKQKNL